MTYQQPWETGYAPKAAPPEPDSRISEIDPQNPFENTLENPEYRMDYRRTLPQILLPGYQIPLFPERDERKAIRKSFNTAGFWIFMSCVLEQVLFLVLMLVIFLCMGVSPGQYLFGLSDKAQAYFQNSSLLIALNGLLFSVLNTSIALIGCRRMRIAPGVSSRRKISAPALQSATSLPESACNVWPAWHILPWKAFFLSAISWPKRISAISRAESPSLPPCSTPVFSHQ